MKDDMETGLEIEIEVEIQTEIHSRVNASGAGNCRKGGDSGNKDGVASSRLLHRKIHALSVHAVRTFPGEPNADTNMTDKQVFFRQT